MTELGPNARSLIELARREDDPNDAARERVQAAFLARLAAAASAPIDPTVQPRGAGLAERFSLQHSALKSLLGLRSSLGLAAFVAAAFGGGALYSQRTTAVSAGLRSSSSSSAVASRVSVPNRLEEQPTAPSEARQATASSPQLAAASSNLGLAQAPRAQEPVAERGSVALRREPGASSARAHELPTGTAARPGTAVRPELARAIEPSVTSDAPSVKEAKAAPSVAEFASTGSSAQRATPAEESLLAEARALREVQRVLRGGNSSRALTLLAEQDRQYANGQLAEARAAARTMALCANQSGENARKTAASFAARWPRSILLPSVRTACVSSAGQSGKENE